MWARSTLCCHPLVPSQPSAEEEDEGEDEAPRAEVKRAVDEAEDKKEDFDEGGEEKATVDVIKPVPEPEDRATEAKGQRRSSGVTASSSRFTFSETSMKRHVFFILSECPCMRSGKESVAKATVTKGQWRSSGLTSSLLHSNSLTLWNQRGMIP